MAPVDSAGLGLVNQSLSPWPPMDEEVMFFGFGARLAWLTGGLLEAWPGVVLVSSSCVPCPPFGSNAQETGRAVRLTKPIPTPTSLPPLPVWPIDRTVSAAKR
jgi:hypothetical protein